MYVLLCVWVALSFSLCCQMECKDLNNPDPVHTCFSWFCFGWPWRGEDVGSHDSLTDQVLQSLVSSLLCVIGGAESLRPPSQHWIIFSSSNQDCYYCLTSPCRSILRDWCSWSSADIFSSSDPNYGYCVTSSWRSVHEVSWSWTVSPQ